MEFAQIPSKATLKPAPFKISISDEKIQEMKSLFMMAKLPPKTYETLQTDRRFGVTGEWMNKAKEEWLLRFDWRKTEEGINSFPHYKVPIIDDDADATIYDIHFVALFSKKPDAIPIAFFHGWPGSFLEFLPIMSILRQRYTPDTLPYHIIAPSLPGYAFSSLPETKNLLVADVARIMNKLIVGLGFGDGYVVQGGDIGSYVSRIMAAEYPGCKAIHLNFNVIAKQPKGVPETSQLESIEQQGLQRFNDFMNFGHSYAEEQGARTSTISFILASNPLALLAWIGEKFLEWTDDDPPIQTVLDSVSLYWLTETYPRSLYPYRELSLPGAMSVHDNPKWHLNKPFGFSWFPKEIAPIPRSWIASSGDLVFFRRHEKGGHFAALERPDVLLKDVEDFIAQVWK